MKGHREGNNYILVGYNLLLIVNLRAQGISYDCLAIMFHCDKSSLRYLCDKYGIWTEEEGFDIRPTLEEVLKEQTAENERWKIMDGEKVNRGRSYRDYLKASPLRRRPRLN